MRRIALGRDGEPHGLVEVVCVRGVRSKADRSKLPGGAEQSSNQCSPDPGAPLVSANIQVT